MLPLILRLITKPELPTGATPPSFSIEVKHEIYAYGPLTLSDLTRTATERTAFTAKARCFCPSLGECFCEFIMGEWTEWKAYPNQ